MKKYQLPAKVKVYQIWYETNIGPTFSSKDKAISYIAKAKEITVEEAKEGLKTGWNGYGYPAIQPITLDVESALFDR